jgi:hypothetical protein
MVLLIVKFTAKKIVQITISKIMVEINQNNK